MEIQQVKSVYIKKTNRLGEKSLFIPKNHTKYVNTTVFRRRQTDEHLRGGGGTECFSGHKNFSASRTSWARFTDENVHCERIFLYSDFSNSVAF